jgi:hypothetical protein
VLREDRRFPLMRLDLATGREPVVLQAEAAALPGI